MLFHHGAFGASKRHSIFYPASCTLWHALKATTPPGTEEALRRLKLRVPVGLNLRLDSTDPIHVRAVTQKPEDFVFEELIPNSIPQMRAWIRDWLQAMTFTRGLQKKGAKTTSHTNHVLHGLIAVELLRTRDYRCAVPGPCIWPTLAVTEKRCEAIKTCMRCLLLSCPWQRAHA